MAEGQLNPGQFGAAIGGSAAIRSAMQRRGIDASVLDQISPAAPGGPSPVAPGVPTTNPQVGAIPSPRPSPAAGPAAPPSRSGEMDIALKALAGTVRTENKIAESQLKLAAPTPAL